jgi:hypothetical protein
MRTPCVSEQLCMQGLGVSACFLLECCYLIYIDSVFVQFTCPVDTGAVACQAHRQWRYAVRRESCSYVAT